MSNDEAAKILADHNAWRRDDDGLLETHSPRVIGEAIDHAIAALLSLSTEARP